MLKKLALMSAVSAFALGSAYAQTTAPSAPAAAPDSSKSDTMKPGPAAAPDAAKSDAMKTGSTGGGTAQFVPSQKPDQFLASKFNGTDVLGSDDQKVGDVSDILFDKAGKIEAYVVSVGGFLGIGSKDVALAPTAFQVIPGDANSATNSSPKLKISMTKEQLKEAANFEPHKPPRATTGAGGGAGGPGGMPRPGGGAGGGMK